MKLSRLLIVLPMAVLLGSAGASLAQFPPPGLPPPPPGLLPPPPFPGAAPPPPPYYQRRPAVRPAVLGDVCYTRRGDCDLDDPRPVGFDCRCFIPGFGTKRGTVGQ